MTTYSYRLSCGSGTSTTARCARSLSSSTSGQVCTYMTVTGERHTLNTQVDGKLSTGRLVIVVAETI